MTAMALVLSLLATIFPVLARVANLDPVQALRYE